jgi:hypothetical protein
LVSGNNSVVECDLAKVEVAGSNPVSRSKFKIVAAFGCSCSLHSVAASPAPPFRSNFKNVAAFGCSCSLHSVAASPAPPFRSLCSDAAL